MVRVSLVNEDGLWSSAGRLLVAEEATPLSIPLSELTDRPSAVELEFIGNEGQLNSSQTVGDVIVDTRSFIDSSVYILATNSADPSDPNGLFLFRGKVNSAATFAIDTNTAGLGRLPADTYLHIFSSSPVAQAFTEALEVEVAGQSQALVLDNFTVENDVLFWSLDWGDGSTETVAANPTVVYHAYDATGPNDVTATAHTAISDLQSNENPNQSPLLLQMVKFGTSDVSLLPNGDQYGAVIVADSYDAEISTLFEASDRDGSADTDPNNDGILADDMGSILAPKWRRNIKEGCDENGS